MSLGLFHASKISSNGSMFVSISFRMYLLVVFLGIVINCISSRGF